MEDFESILFLLIFSVVLIYIINSNLSVINSLPEVKYIGSFSKKITPYIILFISLLLIIFFLFRVFLSGIGIHVDKKYVKVIHTFHKIKIPINSIKYIEGQHHGKISLKEIYGNNDDLWVIAICSTVGTTLIPVNWISFNSKDEALKLSSLLNAEIRNYDRPENN